MISALTKDKSISAEKVWVDHAAPVMTMKAPMTRQAMPVVLWIMTSQGSAV
jgi:hypothetical protein